MAVSPSNELRLKAVRYNVTKRPNLWQEIDFTDSQARHHLTGMNVLSLPRIFSKGNIDGRQTKILFNALIALAASLSGTRTYSEDIFDSCSRFALQGSPMV